MGLISKLATHTPHFTPSHCAGSNKIPILCEFPKLELFDFSILLSLCVCVLECRFKCSNQKR